MKNTTWSKNIPTKAGRYWFYGSAFCAPDSKMAHIDLHNVKVYQGMNSLVFVAEGNFMENLIGLWHTCLVPDLPIDK